MDVASMEFQVGDMAVYPAHGVGKIESIKRHQVGDMEQSFYVMRIVDSNMTVMVPTKSKAGAGLRGIISPDEVDKVFAILNERDVEFCQQTWNQRYREYTSKIRTGSPFEIATVLRDLLLLQADKELSFGEKKMVDTAKGLLVKEIALARKMDEEQVEGDIDGIFAENA